MKEITGGRGADYVFVTVGSAAALQQAFSMLCRGGTAVMVGLPPAADAPGFVPGRRARHQREDASPVAIMGSIRLQVDIPALIALYKAGRYKLDELIAGRYPFEQINEALESSACGRGAAERDRLRVAGRSDDRPALRAVRHPRA